MVKNQKFLEKNTKNAHFSAHLPTFEKQDLTTDYV